MEGQIGFDIRDYESEAAMFEDITKVMTVLIKNDYECLVKYEDAGIYILNYNYNAFRCGEFGADRFMSVTAEEAENLHYERTHPHSSSGLEDDNYGAAADWQND